MAVASPSSVGATVHCGLGTTARPGSRPGGEGNADWADGTGSRPANAGGLAFSAADPANGDR
ncbi:hypothetical protein GCM10027280_61640 [Micromonospora polyrhachis]